MANDGPHSIPLMTSPEGVDARPPQSPATTADVWVSTLGADRALAPAGFSDLTLPEGVTLDSGNGKAFADLMSNAKLTGKERAQGLVDLHRKEQQRFEQEYADRQRKVWGDQSAAWRDDLHADPQLGGNRLSTTLSLVKGAIQHFLPPAEAEEFLRLADATGFSNHKTVIRLIHDMAQKLNIFEDGVTAANPAPPKPERGLGNRGWYGDMGEGND